MWFVVVEWVARYGCKCDVWWMMCCDENCNVDCGVKVWVVVWRAVMRGWHDVYVVV